MKARNLLLPTCLLAIAGSVNAADMSNLYIKGSLGQSSIDVDSIANTTIDDSDSSFSIGGGYKFGKNLSIEAGYRDIGKSSLTATANITDTAYGAPLTINNGSVVSVDATSLYVGASYLIPMNKSFDAYIGAGVNFWTADIDFTGTITFDGVAYTGSVSTDETGSDPYFTVGGTYKLTDNAKLGLEWTRHLDILETDVDTISAVIRYDF